MKPAAPAFLFLLTLVLVASAAKGTHEEKSALSHVLNASLYNSVSPSRISSGRRDLVRDEEEQSGGFHFYPSLCFDHLFLRESNCRKREKMLVTGKRRRERWQYRERLKEQKMICLFSMKITTAQEITTQNTTKRRRSQTHLR